MVGEEGKDDAGYVTLVFLFVPVIVVLAAIAGSCCVAAAFSLF